MPISYAYRAKRLTLKAGRFSLSICNTGHTRPLARGQRLPLALSYLFICGACLTFSALTALAATISLTYKAPLPATLFMLCTLFLFAAALLSVHIADASSPMPIRKRG